MRELVVTEGGDDNGAMEAREFGGGVMEELEGGRLN